MSRAQSFLELENKVCIITGSTSGIGKAIAKELGDLGAKVVINSRSEQRAVATADELRSDGISCLGIGADISDGQQVRSLIERATAYFGGLDVLVNNAGRPSVTDTESLEEEEWREVIDTNLTGAFLCAQAAASVFIPQRSGVVINISSIFGRVAHVRRVAYVVAKHGIEGLTKALAADWAPYGIRVCSVCPGYVATPLVARAMASGNFNSGDLERRTPMGRLGRTEEIAAAVAFLASSSASFVTGAQLTVDGGWVAYGGW